MKLINTSSMTMGAAVLIAILSFLQGVAAADEKHLRGKMGSIISDKFTWSPLRYLRNKDKKNAAADILIADAGPAGDPAEVSYCLSCVNVACLGHTFCSCHLLHIICITITSRYSPTPA